MALGGLSKYCVHVVSEIPRQIHTTAAAFLPNTAAKKSKVRGRTALDYMKGMLKRT